MDLLNHDLAHEFPGYVPKMRSLKTSDPHFSSLFNQYDMDNHAIINYEQGLGVITDEALEDLKKRRLRIKDQIYQILKTS